MHNFIEKWPYVEGRSITPQFNKYPYVANYKRWKYLYHLHNFGSWWGRGRNDAKKPEWRSQRYECYASTPTCSPTTVSAWVGSRKIPQVRVPGSKMYTGTARWRLLTWISSLSSFSALFRIYRKFRKPETTEDIVIMQKYKLRNETDVMLGGMDFVVFFRWSACTCWSQNAIMDDLNIAGATWGFRIAA